MQIVKDKDNIIRQTIPFATLPNGSSIDFLFPTPWSKDKQKSKLVIWLDYEYWDIENVKGEKIFLCHVDGGGNVKIEQFEQADIDKARSQDEQL